jgi:hypothetical protein
MIGLGTGLGRGSVRTGAAKRKQYKIYISVVEFAIIFVVSSF